MWQLNNSLTASNTISCNWQCLCDWWLTIKINLQLMIQYWSQLFIIPAVSCSATDKRLTEIVNTQRNAQAIIILLSYSPNSVIDNLFNCFRERLWGNRHDVQSVFRFEDTCQVHFNPWHWFDNTSDTSSSSSLLLVSLVLSNIDCMVHADYY